MLGASPVIVQKHCSEPAYILVIWLQVGPAGVSLLPADVNHHVAAACPAHLQPADYSRWWFTITSGPDQTHLLKHSPPAASISCHFTASIAVPQAKEASEAAAALTHKADQLGGSMDMQAQTRALQERLREEQLVADGQLQVTTPARCLTGPEFLGMAVFQSAACIVALDG